MLCGAGLILISPDKVVLEYAIETFVWQNIICRFGIPNTIVTDNGWQFDNAKFRQFCSNLKIHFCFPSPAHPQSNGQVEAVNKIIKKTLKTKLDKAKGCWPELLAEVLWYYRITFHISIGETPFSLSFGTEAVAPVEIGPHFTEPVAKVRYYSAIYTCISKNGEPSVKAGRYTTKQ
ncbi:unnamed protein product [Prunus armeniaca]